MADEHISYQAMVNHGVGPMAYTTHCEDFGPCGDRTAPVANGVGAKLARLARRLSDAFAAERQRELDREIARVLARSGGRITDSMEREMMQKIFASDWRMPE
ncbi:MAG: hypothetical protein JO223_20665 [Hyphomicrobiales bacterium]|nr:hypothetical protein [Hyphomicrobiales bacterium]